jgi:hypothetical protein
VIRDREADLVIDPDLTEIRAWLIQYYYFREMSDPANLDVRFASSCSHVGHVLWMIRNHPDAAVLGSPEGSHFGWLTQEERMLLALSWRLAAMAHQRDARVLSNALACELFYSPGPNDDYANLWRAQLNSIRNTSATKP